MEALAGAVRDSAGPGERETATRLAARLEQAGADRVAVEPYRGQPTYSVAHAAHLASGMVAARLGGAAGAALAAGALASLELDASGREQWLRRLLPAGEGANVVGRVPARDRARRTVVVVAHHDAARTGLIWHPRLVQAAASRHLRRRSVDPFMAPVAAGFGLVAGGGAAGALRLQGSRALRAAGAGVLAVALAAVLDVARSATVPGASDNASGVAVVLALTAALASEPLPRTEILVALTGCEESGMEGMAAFLREHRSRLDPGRTLVLGLDTLGAGEPVVCAAEGVLRTHRYRSEDLDRVDAGADRAGVPRPARWRIGGWTDPILARHAGLPAISLVSMGPGYFPNYHRPTDTPDRVDWDSVAACARLAAGILAAEA